MRRRERAVVPRVHRLEHVERLAAADLADDDPVRPHPESVAYEVTHRDLAAALDVRRTRLEPDHMRLADAQFRGILDRDNALVLGHEGREHAEGRGLAGTGPP